MTTYEKVVKRFEQLIQQGADILETNGVAGHGANSVDTELFNRWITSSRALLISVFRANHSVTQMFFEGVSPQFAVINAVEKGRGILISALELVKEGWLDTVEGLVSAEVFSDFLEMADHLISEGYVHAAASLTGAVLEDGLRRIAKKHGIPVKSKDGIDTLNKGLATGSVYNALVKKNVDAWRELRNSADHGKFTEYTKQDVVNMNSGVRQFLAANL